MKRVTILLALAVLVVAALTAGCTSSSPETTPVTTAQPETTTIVTEATTTAAVSLVPEPTDAMPENYGVSATAQKDPIYKTLTVTFNGGKGQEYVTQLTATVIRSDGTTETKSITKPSGSTITRGQTIEFTGTSGQDRVQVWATMDRPLGENNAREFKIYDAVLPPK